MSNLLLAVVYAVVGTVFLARRDRFVAQAKEASQRYPFIPRIPFIGPRSDSEQFNRRLITFDGVFCLVMAGLTVVGWAISR
jgi:hypothetical protein